MTAYKETHSTTVNKFYVVVMVVVGVGVSARHTRNTHHQYSQLMYPCFGLRGTVYRQDITSPAHLLHMYLPVDVVVVTIRVAS